MSSEILHPENMELEMIDWEYSSPETDAAYALCLCMHEACREDGFTVVFSQGTTEGSQIMSVRSCRRPLQVRRFEYPALMKRWEWILDDRGLPKPEPSSWLGHVFGPYEGTDASFVKESWHDAIGGFYGGWAARVVPYHQAIFDWDEVFHDKGLTVGPVFLGIRGRRAAPGNAVTQAQLDGFPVLDTWNDSLCGELVWWLFDEEREGRGVREGADDRPLFRQYQAHWWERDSAVSICAFLVFQYNKRVRCDAVVLLLADVRKVALQIVRGEDGPGLRRFLAMGPEMAARRAAIG